MAKKVADPFAGIPHAKWVRYLGSGRPEQVCEKCGKGWPIRRFGLVACNQPLMVLEEHVLCELDCIARWFDERAFEILTTLIAWSEDPRFKE